MVGGVVGVDVRLGFNVVRNVEVVVQVGVAVEVGVVVDEIEGGPPLGENGAATVGSLDRKPAAKSSFGHEPVSHGFDLQHPRNGGFVELQVYQSPAEHS